MGFLVAYDKANGERVFEFDPQRNNFNFDGTSRSGMWAIDPQCAKTYPDEPSATSGAQAINDRCFVLPEAEPYRDYLGGERRARELNQ